MPNNGEWTDARFHSFIKGGLRGISVRWPPKNRIKQKARVERGVYTCAGFKRSPHAVPASLPPAKGNKRRINNAVVDHIHPIIDPAVGFVSWDEVIKRMFVEEDGLQVLCHACHSKKTKEEKEIRQNVKRI